MDRAGTGRRGEAAAARFYEKQGATLITHNYHTRMGEIDLILREPDGTLVFCEVKTRAKDSLDTPAAAVNAAKQRRIIASAAWYLQSTHQSDEPVRFDVAEVVPLDSALDGTYYKGCFLREIAGSAGGKRQKTALGRCRTTRPSDGPFGKKER